MITDEQMLACERQYGVRYVRADAGHAYPITHRIDISETCPCAGCEAEQPAYAEVRAQKWSGMSGVYGLVELRLYNSAGKLILRDERRDLWGSRRAWFQLIKQVLQHLHAYGRVVRVRPRKV